MKGLLLAALLALAATAQAEPLAEASSLYKLGMYAESLGLYETLAKDQLLDAETRAKALQGVGNCAMQMGDLVKAKGAYQAALQLNPGNAELADYAVKRFGIQAPAVPAATAVATAEATPAPAVEAGPDSWAIAGLKSAVLPGWGQYARGEERKGKAFGILAFGTWIFYAWSLSDANAKVNKYNTYATEAASLKAAGQYYDPYRPDGAYREANAALLANQIALGALATVYGVAIWDAVRGTPEVKQSIFSFEPRHDGLQLALRGTF